MSSKLSHSFSSIKMFENCPLQYYRVRILKDVQNVGGEATIWGEHVHKHLELRLKKEAMLPDDFTHMEPLVLAVERVAGNRPLEAEREAVLNSSLTPTGWWDKDAWLRSKLDVFINRAPHAYVFDWKTGKRRPDFSQLELFALQVFAHHPEVHFVHSAFLWVKEGSMDKETYRREDMTPMWDKVLTRIKRIEQAEATGVWPAKPSGLCPFCPARPTCKYAR